MTPLTHLVSGAAGGSFFAPAFHKLFRFSHGGAVFAISLGSILPDIDALSLLYSSEIYYGFLWYSHHIFGHSLLGAVVLSLAVALLYLFVITFFRGLRNLFASRKYIAPNRMRRMLGFWIATFLGCLIHLLGDVITPPGPWKGIALYWPSMKMIGGLSYVNWHNLYPMYLALMYLPVFFGIVVLAALADILPRRIVHGYGRYARIALHVGAAVLALGFSWQLINFAMDRQYKDMGSRRWLSYNRSLVPREYQKFIDRAIGRGSVVFRKRLIKNRDIIRNWNRVREIGADFQRLVAPPLRFIMPAAHSDAANLELYRSLQRLYPGMGDKLPGRYRLWYFRNSLPDPRYYDRGLVYYLVHRHGVHLMQTTNARVIVFRIDEKDKHGRALRVSRIYESDKVFVPDSAFPQINEAIMKANYHKLWQYNKVPYNAIPSLSSSRYLNLSGGFFPSIEYRTGWLRPGLRRGVYFHSGIWSEGCVVGAYGHFNISQHLQYPFFRLWETADEYIYIKKYGTRVRPGKTRFWGKMMFIRDPEPDAL